MGTNNRTLPYWYLPDTTDSGSIQSLHRVFGVPRILHFHESKARRLSCHPDITDGPVLGECVLNVISVGIVAQAPDVDFAVRVPGPVLGHFFQRGFIASFLSERKSEPVKLYLKCELYLVHTGCGSCGPAEAWIRWMWAYVEQEKNIFITYVWACPRVFNYLKKRQPKF